MRWVVANIYRIMILSGLLTMTMIYAALASSGHYQLRANANISQPQPAGRTVASAR
jgi:hypothetical protein